MHEWFAELASWAWARHHNVLSWYVRPLFFLPFCFFAYRRSVLGIVVTLVALVTSMAWFPAPALVHAAIDVFRALAVDPADTVVFSLYVSAIALVVPLVAFPLGRLVRR